MVETQSAPEGFSLSGHKTHKLQESDMTKAPIFEINDSDGKPFKMEDHFPMVLYFYPKDSTSGCTTEAKEFTALIPEFQKLGYDVVGVSRDSEKSHQNFICRYTLAITLLSDPEEKACKAYDVSRGSLIADSFAFLKNQTVLKKPLGFCLGGVWIRAETVRERRSEK